MSYQTLDTIADAYVPTLLLVILLSLFAQIRQPKVAFKGFCCVFLLAFIAYSLMFVDIAQGLWAKRGWDYSTHTATAAACAWYLFWLHKNRGILGGFFQRNAVKVLWPLTLLGYLGLMRYQNYHSWADMVTTLLAILPFFCIHYFATR